MTAISISTITAFVTAFKTGFSRICQLQRGIYSSLSSGALLTVLLMGLGAPAGVTKPLDFFPNNVPLSADNSETLTLPIEGVNASAPIQSGSQAVNYRLCPVGSFGFSGFGGSDCWGYLAPDGTEYAIMGINIGVVFVNVTTMTVADTVLGPNGGCGAFWRDMATMGQYCYVVSECSGVDEGLQVIDMSYLPDSVHLVNAFPIDGVGYNQSHNLSIDSIAGFLYIEGWGTVGQQVQIHDLSNPASPAHIGGVGDSPNGSIHDIYASGDTLYIAEGSGSGYSIWDMTSKSSPSMMVRWTSPSGGYAHNIWPTDDRRHVVTTEETGFRTVKIWNIEDMLNIQLVGEYLAASNLAHNAHLKGDTIYLSHYESGLAVVDISNPASPVELGIFDTWPASNNAGFNGSWGVYPFAPNGHIYISNDFGQLNIVEERFEGSVADTMTIDSIFALAGSQVKVDVYVTNTFPLQEAQIPFSWDGPAGLTFDSVSTVGLRTEYFEEVNPVGFSFLPQATYSLSPSNDGSLPALEPGNGPILSLFFTVPDGTSGLVNEVVFKDINGKFPFLRDDCGLVTLPDTTSGGVTIDGCCGEPGDANNNQTTNISDAIFIINLVFNSGPAPLCSDEADANANGAVNIADAIALIAYVFSSGVAPVCGPSGS